MRALVFILFCIVSSTCFADERIIPYLPVDGCLNNADTMPCDNTWRDEPDEINHDVIDGDLLVTDALAEAYAPFIPILYCGQHYRYKGVNNLLDKDGSSKCYIRNGLYIVGINDSQDIGFRAFALDSEGNPIPMEGSHTLGRIYGQVFRPGTECDAPVGMFYNPCGTGSRVVDLLFRNLWSIAAGHGGGQFLFRASRMGQHNPIDSVIINAPVEIGAGSPLEFYVQNLDNTALVRRRIEIGANDSCGAGYACLRIPNR